MNFKIFMRSVLGAVVLCLLFIWLQDILSGEEGRVRKFILRGKQAVETKDFFACADIVSASYSDKYGNSRETLLYATKEFFGYYKEIFVNIESMEINFDEAKTKASVEIVALVIGKTQQNNAEKILEGNKGRFRIKLIKEEKKWYLLELEFFEPITVMGQNIS